MKALKLICGEMLVLLSVHLPWIANTARAQASVADEQRSRDRINALREIDDPVSGTHWLLVKDPCRPEGPGRLVRGDGALKDTIGSLCCLKKLGASRAIERTLPRVIRGGDGLVVEDNAGAATARVEGVALEPAGVGSVLRVRLRMSGSIVKAVVVARGRAKLVSQIEVPR
jgi:Chaperone for flagella basal body P-ring formation